MAIWTEDDHLYDEKGNILLQRKFKAIFPKIALTKGERLFTEKKVSQSGKAPNHLEFKVKPTSGSEETICNLTWVTDEKDYPRLSISCDCLEYVPHEHTCEHLWASLLYGDDTQAWVGNFDGIKTRANKKRQHWLKNFTTADELLTDDTPTISRTAYYLVHIDETTERLTVSVQYRRLTPTKGLSKRFYEQTNIRSEDIGMYHDPIDRELLMILSNSMNMYYWYPSSNIGFKIPEGMERLFWEKVAKTGRLFLAEQWHNDKQSESPSKPLVYLGEHRVFFDINETKRGYTVLGGLTDGEQKLEQYHLTDTAEVRIFVTECGLGFLDDPKAVISLRTLEGLKNRIIPRKDRDLLMKAIHSQPYVPLVNWIGNLSWQTLETNPVPGATVDRDESTKTGFSVVPYFVYGDYRIDTKENKVHLVDEGNKLVHIRDKVKEEDHIQTLSAMPELRTRPLPEPGFKVKKNEVVNVIRTLLSKGWQVETDDKTISEGGDINISVSSGIDWFDLEADIQFASGQSVKLPELVKALKKGDPLVALKDGGLGIIPEEWFEKYAPLTEAGNLEGEAVRFSKTQGLLLSGWLARDENATFDIDFEKFQKQSRSFTPKNQVNPAKEFQGQLRDYQKTGLAWLEYLNTMELGGILADDMGLGKTVQLLAFLQKIKTRDKELTHLIVVPKSVLGNWQDEATRFTPNMKIAIHAGLSRIENDDFKHHDIIITTYHTLRADFEKFQDKKFDCVVLDEAQVIKNPKALTSRVCKSIQGRRKIALTGTPIENSIEDLFSIMDFANQGLVSSALRKRFANKKITTMVENKTGDLEALNNSLAPVILRRTKEEVLKELPEKSVDFLRCELSPKERKNYQELKTYYQALLRQRVF